MTQKACLANIYIPSRSLPTAPMAYGRGSITSQLICTFLRPSLPSTLVTCVWSRNLEGSKNETATHHAFQHMYVLTPHKFRGPTLCTYIQDFTSHPIRIHVLNCSYILTVHMYNVQIYHSQYWFITSLPWSWVALFSRRFLNKELAMNQKSISELHSGAG